LVIDEALAVGDAFFTQKCMRFLRKFMESGTILFVSHDTSAITSLCSSAILLKKGAIALNGDPKDVSEKYLEALYGESQELGMSKGSGAVDRGSLSVKEEHYRDIREGMINSSVLRNDIELFQFDGVDSGFGAAGAKITSVQFQGIDGMPLSWVIGGQEVILNIKAIALKGIFSPIIGFQFKNRLGQVLFADNTYLSFKENPKTVFSGHEFSSQFQFHLPILPAGDHSVSVAVAEGVQDEHIQHHWIHDAITVKVHASSVCFGLMGVPMKKINLMVQP